MGSPKREPHIHLHFYAVAVAYLGQCSEYCLSFPIPLLTPTLVSDHGLLLLVSWNFLRHMSLIFGDSGMPCGLNSLMVL
jgi:hypothetical protein